MKLYTLLTLALGTQIFAQELPLDCSLTLHNDFKASYEVTTNEKSNVINYYRQKQKVAYEYPSQGITEIWIKLPKNQTSLIRAFDKAKRAIEYEPIDLKMESKGSLWSQKENFLSPSKLGFKKSETKIINGCTVQHFQKQVKSKIISMDWYEKTSLLVGFKIIEKDEIKSHYILKSLSPLTKDNNHLAKAMSYETTDYADIGDNESDPFFRKMINLGFIKHYEANIIDENGEFIGMTEHHH